MKKRLILVGVMLAALCRDAATGAGPATVVYRAVTITGSVNNRQITYSQRTDPLAISTNLVFGARTLQPTNGVAVTNLVAGKYWLRIDQVAKQFPFDVPDNTNTYNIIDLINNGIYVLGASNGVSMLDVSNVVSALTPANVITNHQSTVASFDNDVDVDLAHAITAGTITAGSAGQFSVDTGGNIIGQGLSLPGLLVASSGSGNIGSSTVWNTAGLFTILDLRNGTNGNASTLFGSGTVPTNRLPANLTNWTSLPTNTFDVRYDGINAALNATQGLAAIYGTAARSNGSAFTASSTGVATNLSVYGSASNRVNLTVDSQGTFGKGSVTAGTNYNGAGVGASVVLNFDSTSNYPGMDVQPGLNIVGNGNHGGFTFYPWHGVHGEATIQSDGDIHFKPGMDNAGPHWVEVGGLGPGQMLILRGDPSDATKSGLFEFGSGGGGTGTLPALQVSGLGGVPSFNFFSQEPHYSGGVWTGGYPIVNLSSNTSVFRSDVIFYGANGHHLITVGDSQGAGTLVQYGDGAQDTDCLVKGPSGDYSRAGLNGNYFNYGGLSVGYRGFASDVGATMYVLGTQTNSGLTTIGGGLGTFSTNRYSVTATGYTNATQKTIRIVGLTGTSIVQTNAPRTVGFSRGTITTPTDILLQPQEFIIGTSVAAQSAQDF